MCKIKFYLLPSQNYRCIGSDELLILDRNLSYIMKEDVSYVPNEFYEIQDVNGICGSEYLYGEEQTDSSAFLLEILKTQKVSEESYGEINQEKEIGYTIISKSDTTCDTEHLCVYSIKNTYENGCVIVNDVLKIRRKYLCNVSNFDLFKKRSDSCFPDLIFHVDAFKDIKKLGKISDVITELIRHLNALNDYGKIIYKNCNGSENEALNSFGSKCNIKCSGKGANETKSF